MTTSFLPLRQDALTFGFTTDLSGEDFTFSFFWNDQDESWYFNLDDADGVRIRSGVKVVLGGLLNHRQDFPGALFAMDLSGQDEPPGSDDFGTRVVLAYVD